MTESGIDDLAGHLASPDVYPQKLDLDGWNVLLIRLDAAAYRAASFLDDRIVGPATRGAWYAFDRVEGAAQGVAHRPLHFIFHTGHVGSTLVSRLVDEAGGSLPLREPLPLRTLAEAHDHLHEPDSAVSEAQFERARAALLALWARGYETTRSVVLKATSSAGRLAERLLAARPSSRAIYMNVRAEPYLATLLAGQNSPADLRGHGPERWRRLQARIALKLQPLHALSPGELAALAWLSETWTQRDALRRFPERVLAIDFEAFLAAVADGMARILGHFGLDGGQSGRALAASAVLTRYSKAPEYAYTPSVRSEVLREARERHRAEIGSGLAWLERLARAEGAVAEILDGRI